MILSIFSDIFYLNSSTEELAFIPIINYLLFKINNNESGKNH